MGRGAAAPATVVIGTVEILDIVIALVEVVIQVVTAIRAYQQAAEHITFAVLRLSTANLATLFLNLFPDHTINNQLMHVFENRPVFPVVGNPLLVFVGFGVGLEIQDIPAILLQSENIHDGGGVPFGGWLLLCPSGLSDSLLQPIGARGEDTFRFKNRGDLLRSIPIHILKIRRTTWAASSSMIQCLGFYGSFM